mgnify:FL=1
MAIPPSPRRRPVGLLLCLLTCSAFLACRSRPSGALPASTVVDSVIPRDVALARFRQGLQEPSGLADGARTRDSLFRLALRALTAQDTALIRRLTLSQAEFAWYYYPSNPQAYPPYDLDPQMMWFLLLGNSENGLRTALHAYGGRPLQYRDGRCEGDSSVQGDNVLWGPCWLGYGDRDGAGGEERLLKVIIRRGGTYKVVSWANKLD